MVRNPVPTQGSTPPRSMTPMAQSRAVRKGPSYAFGELLDSVPGAWFLTRSDGSFAYVSLGACEALGYSRRELLAAKVFEIDPTFDAEAWWRHWEATVPTQTSTLRTRHRRRDGSEFPVEVRSLKIELDGEPLAASYSADLTSSEPTRAAPQAGESRLEGLIAHLPDLVFRLRVEPCMSFELISPSSRALLGYAPSELVGDEGAIARIVHAADLERFLALHRTELLRRAEPSGGADAARGAGHEIRFVDKGGRVLWMELRFALVRASDDQPSVIEGVARDVTQRHHAELPRRRLLAAIEQAAEAVVVTDAGGNVEYVNPAYRHATGIAEADALGRPWRELEVRKDRAFLRRLRAAFERGEVWQGRIQSVRTSGRSYDEDATLAPIRDEAGKQVGCVAVKRDITEQLALEEQLHQKQKLEAVGQLAGGIAHDFNNLLHVIQGHTHMMQGLDLCGFARAVELTEMLSEVDKAAERAAVLVRQLLAFSRKGGAEFSELCLDELLATSHGPLQRLIGQHIQLVLTCHAGRVSIEGNRAQLEQLLTNLCINARDAMPPGGYLHIGLWPTTQSELPTVFREQAEEEYVRLTVRDEGAGMTREVQQRLYEPFFTTKRAGEGIGLGLATVYAIVQGHRGFIDSVSTQGQGTTFNVYLPRCDSPERVALRGPARTRIDGRGRLALVAEDEPAVLQLTSCYLRQSGFGVLSATNGPEAERLLVERGPEIALAVLDAVMPGFGGQGLHQVMKDRGLTAPVIFVTGYDYQTLSGAPGEENVAILRKPFGAKELLDQVARLLRETA